VTLIGNDLRAQFVDKMMGLDIQPQMPKKATTDLVASLSSSLAARDADQAAGAVQTHFDQLRVAVVSLLQNLSTEVRQEAV
ncbi:MAG: hypothetical protein RL120_02185, partial [Gammaproteobacteria bacterium]